MVAIGIFRGVSGYLSAWVLADWQLESRSMKKKRISDSWAIKGSGASKQHRKPMHHRVQAMRSRPSPDDPRPSLYHFS